MLLTSKALEPSDPMGETDAKETTGAAPKVNAEGDLYGAPLSMPRASTRKALRSSTDMNKRSGRDSISISISSLPQPAPMATTPAPREA